MKTLALLMVTMLAGGAAVAQSSTDTMRNIRGVFRLGDIKEMSAPAKEHAPLLVVSPNNTWQAAFFNTSGQIQHKLSGTYKIMDHYVQLVTTADSRSEKPVHAENVFSIQSFDPKSPVTFDFRRNAKGDKPWDDRQAHWIRQAETESRLLDQPIEQTAEKLAGLHVGDIETDPKAVKQLEGVFIRSGDATMKWPSTPLVSVYNYSDIPEALDVFNKAFSQVAEPLQKSGFPITQTAPHTDSAALKFVYCNRSDYARVLRQYGLRGSGGSKYGGAWIWQTEGVIEKAVCIVTVEKGSTASITEATMGILMCSLGMSWGSGLDSVLSPNGQRTELTATDKRLLDFFVTKVPAKAKSADLAALITQHWQF